MNNARRLPAIAQSAQAEALAKVGVSATKCRRNGVAKPIPAPRNQKPSTLQLQLNQPPTTNYPFTTLQLPIHHPPTTHSPTTNCPTTNYPFTNYQNLVQSNPNPRTGEIKPPSRAERQPQQGRTPSLAGKESCFFNGGQAPMRNTYCNM